jgi:hypothetical protein
MVSYCLPVVGQLMKWLPGWVYPEKWRADIEDALCYPFSFRPWMEVFFRSVRYAGRIMPSMA